MTGYRTAVGDTEEQRARMTEHPRPKPGQGTAPADAPQRPRPTPGRTRPDTASSAEDLDDALDRDLLEAELSPPGELSRRGWRRRREQPADAPSASQQRRMPKHAATPAFPVERRQEAPAGTDEAESDAAAGRLSRATRWLLEQAPERSAEGTAQATATEPAATEPATAEATATEPARLPPGTDLARRLAAVHASAEAGPRQDPDAAPAPGADGSRPRPRPRPGPSAAPDPPPAPATGAAAAEASPEKKAFFERPEEDDDSDARKPEDTHVKKRARAPRLRKRLRTLLRLGIFLLIVVAAAALLRTYVVSPYYIPSASMEPTLHGCSGCNNDHVLVDKVSYRMHDIQRGDIVVFHRPSTWKVSESVLVKRVIGVPGDKLQLKNSKLYVNGLLLDEAYLNDKCGPMRQLSESPRRATSTIGAIPDGDIFVMGDNRCDSLDSRAFGPVPESDVIGRAFVIIWPLSRLGTL